MLWIQMIALLVGSSRETYQLFLLFPSQIEARPIKLAFYQEEVNKRHFSPLFGEKVHCEQDEEELEICTGITGYLHQYHIPARNLRFEEELKSDFFSSEQEKVYEISSFIYDQKRLPNWSKYGNIIFANRPWEDSDFSWRKFLLFPWYRGGEMLVYLPNPQHLTAKLLFARYGLGIEKQQEKTECQSARIFGKNLECIRTGIILPTGNQKIPVSTTPLLLIKNANQDFFLLIEQEMVSSKFGKIEIFS